MTRFMNQCSGFSASGGSFEPSGEGRKQEGPAHCIQGNCWSQSLSLKMEWARTPFTTSSVANRTVTCYFRNRRSFLQKGKNCCYCSNGGSLKPINMWHIVQRTEGAHDWEELQVIYESYHTSGVLSSACRVFSRTRMFFCMKRG